MNEYLKDTKITPESKALYAYIRAFSDEYPTHERMANDMCMSSKTVRRHLDVLEMNDYINIQRRKIDGVSKCVYYVLK